MGLFTTDHKKVELLERKNDVPRLIKALKNSDRTVRVHALEALGRLPDPRAAVPVIIVCDRDQEWDVRCTAADVLGVLGDRRAVGVLIKSLSYPEVLTHAARALGMLGDYRAVEPLLNLLTLESPIAEEAAYEALGRLGDEHAAKWIFPKLNSPDKDERLAAAKALYKLLPESHEHRAVIVSTLEKMGMAADPLLRAWRLYLDGNWAALGESHDEHAFSLLSRALWEQKGDALADVLRALGRFEGSKAVEMVVNFLLKRKGGVNDAALSALRDMGEALADALCASAGDKAVREKALSLMDRLGRGSDPRVKVWRLAAKKDAWKRLPAFGEAAVEPIISVIERDNTEYAVLIKALGDIGGLRAANYLISILGKKSYNYYNYRVSEALVNMRSEEVEALLLEKLNDAKNDDLRFMLYVTLGNMGCQTVAAQIIEQVKIRYADSRSKYPPDATDLCALIDALGQLKTADARPVLAPLVREGLTQSAKEFHKFPRHYTKEGFYSGDNNDYYRFFRTITLSAARALEKLDLSDAPEERMWALAALGKWDELSGYGRAAAEIACAAMCTTDIKERRKAITALEIIGGQQAVNALIREANLNYDIKDRAGSSVPEALLALSRIGDGSCVDTLISKLAFYHYRVPAAQALVALYQSGRLDEAARLKVLNERETIVKPHVDTVETRSYACSDFNSSTHTDRGLGVEFPL